MVLYSRVGYFSRSAFCSPPKNAETLKTQIVEVFFHIETPNHYSLLLTVTGCVSAIRPFIGAASVKLTHDKIYQ
jgi:hypothetical protein